MMLPLASGLLGAARPDGAEGEPRPAERAFVLLPLAEIAPEWALAAQDPAITGQQIERIVPIERTDPGDRLVRTESRKP